jgi:hypothetical protein
MVFAPKRTALLIRHFLWLVLLIPVMALSLIRLVRYPPDPIGAIGLVFLVAALVILPAVISRLVLLARIGYRLAPGGGLELRFGQRFERLPIEAIEEIRSGGNIPASDRAKAPGWWDSWSGRTSTPDMEKPIDWFATTHDEHLMFIVQRDRALAISPADPTGFLRAISDWGTHGAMEKVEPVSVEPAPLFMDIFDHAAATSLIVVGLVEATFLGAFVIGIQPALPAAMAFKFSVAGSPIAPGDPFRLIILPIACGIIWVVNVGLAWIEWRQNDFVAAYILWGSAVLVGIGLWFATIVLAINR